MNENNPHSDPLFPEDPIRHHTYDGIQEYDKKLPNWWLMTLFGTIFFAFGYWFYYEWTGFGPTSVQSFEQEMAEHDPRNRVLVASSDVKELTNDDMWKMSHDAKIVSAGATTFATTCSSCHGTDATGKIGPNLKDEVWIHGGQPLEIVHTITTGVPEKGMPTWGPLLGEEKIHEVAAFILSFHNPKEPIIPAQGTQAKQ